MDFAYFSSQTEILTTIQPSQQGIPNPSWIWHHQVSTVSKLVLMSCEKHEKNYDKYHLHRYSGFIQSKSNKPHYGKKSILNVEEEDKINMADRLLQFGNFLMSADNYDGYPSEGEYVLFTNHGDDEWSTETICCVLYLTPEQSIDWGYVPDFAKKHGLRQSMGIAFAQDIVSAARQMKPDCDESDLVKAVIYYYENDSFYPFDE